VVSDKESLYNFARERYEFLIKEPQYQKVINIPQQLFIMAYLQGMSDLEHSCKALSNTA